MSNALGLKAKRVNPTSQILAYTGLNIESLNLLATCQYNLSQQGFYHIYIDNLVDQLISWRFVFHLIM